MGNGMNQRKIDQCVEALCGLGCRTVSSLIQRMERGEPLAETAYLEPEERQAVLAELKSIMAVYGARCGV